MRASADQVLRSDKGGQQLWTSSFTEKNLALFKKRLTESHSDAEREVLLKLLVDEEAKEPPPKIGVLKPR